MLISQKDFDIFPKKTTPPPKNAVLGGVPDNTVPIISGMSQAE